MKKSTFIRTVFILSVLFGNTMRAQIRIDASQLTEGENKDKEWKADFSKKFSVFFLKNSVSTSVEIKVTNKDGAPVIIKKGITTAEKDSFMIDFSFSVISHNLVVKKANGNDVEISPDDTLQIIYGADKSVLIAKGIQEGSGKKIPESQIPSGIELHDAIQAKELYVKKDYKALYSLLGKIKKLNTDNPTKSQLLSDVAYGKNPFIKKLLEGISDGSIDPQVGGGLFSSGLSGFVSEVGNLDITTIADGFARFLVKRTKEELNIAFFQHFKDLINDERYKDVQILFPKAMETLNAIDQEIYQFENYITTLRESFEEDLSTLLDHMPQVIEEGRFKEYFEKYHDIKYAALVSLSMAKDLVNGSHPGEALQLIPEEYIDGFASRNVTGSVKTIQLLSASIRSRGNEKYWTSLDSVKMLVTKEDSDLIAAKFYLGYIYEKAADISFQGNDLQTYLKAILEKEDEITKTITFVKQLGQYANNIETSLEKIKNKKPEEPTIDVYHRLFNSISDLVEHLNKLGELSFINNPIDDQVKRYLNISRQAFDFALNIGHKNYGSAVVNVYNIYLKITSKQYDASKEKLNDNEDLFFVEHGGENVNGSKRLLNTNTTEEKNTEKGDTSVNKKDKNENNVRANAFVLKVVFFIKKYGSFMANVVKAKTSEEVAAAIESVALPVGSATIKRHSEWNIALNAYVGPYLGREKIKGIDDGESKPNTAGITAPIGFSISHGINWRKKGGWSTSLFISIIDLGAPVAFRFKDDKTEQIPSIQLKDIISPGIFASIGFPKFPVSCNIGWQSGPLLRKIDPQFASLASSTYSRWSISFAVDIPILNFYTRRN